PAGPRPDHPAHLAPLLDGAQGRPHRGHRAGSDRRAGHARGADGPRRALRAPLHLAGEGLPVSARAVCFDLLSALLDSWSVWDGVATEIGHSELGRPWRLRSLEITSNVGAYRPYLELVARAATEVGLPDDAMPRLERAWADLRPWPDVVPALRSLGLPRAVATNCSITLGRAAVACVGIPFDAAVTAHEAAPPNPHPPPPPLL